MKQFFKQLGAGIGAILALIAVAIMLWGISALVLKVTGWINIEVIIQNVHWIVLGMVLLILIQALGALVLNVFSPDAKTNKQERARRKAIKRQNRREEKVAKRERFGNFQQFDEQQYATEQEEYTE